MGLNEQPGKVNYFIGKDTSKWLTNVPIYTKVKFKDVYPGIDLVYYGTKQGQLEFDFVVAPGIDPQTIAFDVTGANELSVDEHGDIVAQIVDGTDNNASQVRFRKPYTYQEINGITQEIPSYFVFREKIEIKDQKKARTYEIGFRIDTYDTSKPLVIDPVLTYSTFIGPSAAHGWGEGGIAVDASGDAYVAGYTPSTDFPILNTFQSSNHGQTDVFVTKLNPSGSGLVYSTYLGGLNTDGGRYGGKVSVGVDAYGNAYVGGTTWSGDFPTFNAFQADCGGWSSVFVTKLDPSGSGLVYSTCLHGTQYNNPYMQYNDGWGLAVDAQGNAYVTGYTDATDFPTTASAFQRTKGSGWGGDVFVTKFNPFGGIAYSTYLGGNGWDSGYGIAVDVSGNAHVTGYTTSTNLPIANAFQATLRDEDAFVTKLNSTGTGIVYSTYLGGTGTNEFGKSIAVDTSGNAYVTGYTGASNFPTSTNAFQKIHGGGFYDAFVTKFSHSGTLVYSTYLGGCGHDSARGIAVDAHGNAYVTGNTMSPNFPTVNALQAAYGGGGQHWDYGDVFVTQLDAPGTGLIYSTYLGRSYDEFGYSIAVDTSGSAYLTGWTQSPDFPTVNAFQTNFQGTTRIWNVFVSKIAPVDLPPGPADRADLAVTEIAVLPSSGFPGTTATLTLTIKNQGLATGSCGFNLEAWTSGSVAPACGGKGNISSSIGPLSPGESVTLSYPFTFPASPGTYTAKAFIDSKCAVAESNEINNIASTYYTVTEHDLSVTGITVTPTSGFPGTSAILTVSVTNQGLRTANDFQLNTWLSSGAMPSCGEVSDVIDISTSLAPGATITFNYPFTLPTVPGLYATRSFIDSQCMLAETSELNNIASAYYMVEKPLILTCPSNIRVSAGANCQAAIPDIRDNVMVTGNSGTVTFAQNPAPGTFVGLGEHIITVRGTDASGYSSTCATTYAVTNTVPEITSIIGYAPLALGAKSTVTLSFTDADVDQGHTARFSWGDSTSDTVVTTETEDGKFIAEHLYTAASVYTITASVTDACGASTTTTALDHLIKDMVALPDIISSLPGISTQLVNSLTSKVENALKSLEKENTAAGINTLNALLNEISAQTGKMIDTNTADILTKYFQSLIVIISSQ